MVPKLPCPCRAQGKLSLRPKISWLTVSGHELWSPDGYRTSLAYDNLSEHQATRRDRHWGGEKVCMAVSSTIHRKTMAVLHVVCHMCYRVRMAVQIATRPHNGSVLTEVIWLQLHGTGK